jgi:hypothetical protein
MPVPPIIIDKTPMVMVDVLTPGDLASLPSSLPVQVAGTATGLAELGDGEAEPNRVHTVTVSVDGGPQVHASLVVASDVPLPMVKFSATVTLTAGYHEIVITAAADRGTGSAKIGVNGFVEAFTPLQSLEIFVTNPVAPTGGDWATQIVKESRSSFAALASLLSLAVWAERGDQFPVCAREWTQVIAPGEDYDDEHVGFSGWLLQPELSGNDVPMSHPFGKDWECMVALDPQYSGLLAAGNIQPDGNDGQLALEEAETLHIPVPIGGLLAVEEGQLCVPRAFRSFGDEVLIGDRIALFGRWIVDTGHAVTLDDGTTSYRAEVHPPLLMAIGGTREPASGTSVTRVMLTSRPYLVKQVYAKDTSTIYDDNAPDDGTLLAHLNNEIDELHGIIPSSLTIEAHPKIASKPFRGIHIFHLRVRPPANILPVFTTIEVSFQFTRRSGVAVEVVDGQDGADIWVAFNDVGYSAPPLPQRQTVTFTKDQLGQASDIVSLEQVASLFEGSPVSVAVAEHALDHGIDTDSYKFPDVDVLDRSHALPFVALNQIPAGQGIVVENEQPYPIFGFLEIRRTRQQIIVAAPGSSAPTHESTS